jgi:hypothetical protein
MPIAANAGLVMISPSNTNPGLTLRPFASVFGWDFDQLHSAGAGTLPTTGPVVATCDIHAATPFGIPQHCCLVQHLVSSRGHQTLLTRVVEEGVQGWPQHPGGQGVLVVWRASGTEGVESEITSHPWCQQGSGKQEGNK